MSETESGRFTAAVPAEGSGLVRLRSGELTTVAALGPINPVEYADLRPTGAVLDPFVDGSGGGHYAIGEGANADLPALRRTRAGADQAGRTWLGLTRHERYVVQASTRTPLLPGLLMVMLLAAVLGMGWWREGR